ncbi:hypothetical protein JL720_9850 [Aureococcus anophagefferens]|nr:hypothetical protein JL720_9850 [Aureococcus anophagefferens]
MDAYRLLGERYRFLNRVPAREGAAPAEVLQLPATADAAATGDVARVRLLLARAARVDGAFRSRTTALIAAFNGASSTAALAATLGLDPAAWHLDHRDAGTALGAAPLRLKPGPPKSHGRALEKPLGSLKDLNRCTVECHCPYVCALFLAGLRETFIMWYETSAAREASRQTCAAGVRARSREPFARRNGSAATRSRRATRRPGAPSWLDARPCRYETSALGIATRQECAAGVRAIPRAVRSAERVGGDASRARDVAGASCPERDSAAMRRRSTASRRARSARPASARDPASRSLGGTGGDASPRASPGGAVGSTRDPAGTQRCARPASARRLQTGSRATRRASRPDARPATDRQLGKQRVFRLILKTIVRAIMPYLDPEDVAKHFDRRAAERAIARANSDRFRRGMVLGDGIIATILMNQPDLKGLLPTEPPCVYEDSDAANWLEPSKTWLQARAEGGSLYHATNVAPENLLCVDGTPYLLRPYDHYERGRPAYAGVWATCYSAGKALGFVQAHKHKSFVTNARDKGEDLFIYILSRDHPDYGNFHQLFVRYGIPSGGCGFFASARVHARRARHVRATARPPRRPSAGPSSRSRGARPA